MYQVTVLLEYMYKHVVICLSKALTVLLKYMYKHVVMWLSKAFKYDSIVPTLYVYIWLPYK